MSESISKLEAARLAKGVSRERVAAELDMTSQTIYRLERGKTPVKMVHLRALAELYGVPVESLIETPEAA